jgi:hypothetical protein
VCVCVEPGVICSRVQGWWSNRHAGTSMMLPVFITVHVQLPLEEESLLAFRGPRTHENMPNARKLGRATLLPKLADASTS